MEGPRFDARQGKQEIFSFPKRPDCLYVTSSLLLSGRGVRLTSQLNSAEVKNVWSRTSTLPMSVHGMCNENVVFTIEHDNKW